MGQKIVIHERFLSWQGEGVHMGRSAYFIRTYGCAVKCTFCDSAGTWHPDYKPEGMEKLSSDILARAVHDSAAAICVITGGEPTHWDWTEFLRFHHELRAKYFQTVHLETSGAFPIRGEFDWITLSPKKAKFPLEENWYKASELKLIIESPEDIQFWLGEIPANARPPFLSKSVWLHPEWSQSRNPEVLNAITEAVKRYPQIFRAGWQLHKNYRADYQDAGTRQEVPLGGKV